MRILAIDTALGACAAAVYDSEAGTTAAVESLAMARGHAEALLPLVARVMDRAGMEFLELDRIAVTVGPGSFTGLRVGIAAARGIALAAGRPAVGVSTLSAYAAPHIAIDQRRRRRVAIDARNDQIYFQLFGPAGRSLVSPRHVAISEAVGLEAGARARPAVPLGRLGRGSAGSRVAGRISAAHRRRTEGRARYRMGRKARRRRAGGPCAAQAGLPAPARCAAAGRRRTAAAMIDLLARLLGRAEPSLGDARPADAAALAALHAASFRRGWSEDEMERLLIDRNVIAHRATFGREIAGFILSRLAAGEAEILSVAVARRRQGRGVARRLLALHLRRWRASGCAPCSSKSRKAMPRHAGCMRAPASARWRGVRATIRTMAGSRSPPSCCGAT